MVDMSGLTTSEIQCVPDADKLAALGITVEELQRALAENDIRLSALTVADGIYQYNVHFDSQILTVDDVRNVYINHEGRLLQLKDLCKIEEHPAIRRNIVRHNGKNCVTLCIIKQNDAQMDELKSEVDNVIADLEKTYPDLEFDITRDQTELLSYSINNLEWNLLAAAFLPCWSCCSLCVSGAWLCWWHCPSHCLCSSRCWHSSCWASPSTSYPCRD